MVAKDVAPTLTRHFKYFRIGAIYSALSVLNESQPSYRLMHSSLTLGAILIYMLNALNYRPAEGRREIELAETCCWNVYKDDMDSDIAESDEDEDPVPVMLDYGLYFISGVRLQEGKSLRMGRGDAVSMESIASLYKVRNDQDLKVAFHLKTWHADPDQRSRNRTQNRRKVPVDVRLVASKDELMAQDTSLADLGIAVHMQPQEAGPDIQVLHHMDEDQDVQQEGIDDVAARIWRQFPYDLFENAPNHRSNRQGSHLLLSEQQRSQATIEVFKDTDLSQLFSRVVVKVVKPEKWQNLEFKRYFPAKGFVVPTRLQNFPRMRYFQEWNTLMDSLSHDDAQVVRDSFWNIFKTFKWLPLTDTDRIWNTKKVKPTNEWIHLPHDDNKPVVRIGLNGRLVRDPKSIQLFVEAPVSDSGEESPRPMEIDDI
jgi:hypothetical protein